MGNRAALILAPGPPPDTPGELAFGTNNYLAPFWFAACAEEDLAGWESRWRALAVEDPPDGAAEAAVLWIPWPVAQARLAQAAATVARFAPPWAALFGTWHAALLKMAAREKAQFLGLNLVEIFAFHEDPATMLRDARDGIAVFQGDTPPVIAGDLQDEMFGGYPYGLPSPTPRPPTPRPKASWKVYWHLPALALFTWGAWDFSGSVIVTAVVAALLLAAFAMLVRRGG